MERPDRGWHVEIDGSPTDAWSDLLARFEDATIFQTCEYGAFRYGEERLTRMVLRHDGRIRAAALGSIVRVPGLRVGLAHFAWCPMWRLRDEHDEQRAGETLDRVLHEMRQEYAVRRGLVLRVRAYEAEPEDGRSASSGRFEAAGFERSPEPFYRTILLDLADSLEEIRARMRPWWRRHLRAAEKRDFTVAAGGEDELFERFGWLYRQTVARKDMASYEADIDGYRELQRRLPTELKLQVLICSAGDEPIAGSVLAAVGDTGMYLLGATSDRAVRENLRGAYLLHWRAIEWLKERGCRTYDLRGYEPEKYPGVSRFKTGLGGRIVAYPEFVAPGSAMSSAALALGEGVSELAASSRRRLRRLLAGAGRG